MNTRTYILIGILGVVLLIAAYVYLGPDKSSPATGEPGLATRGSSVSVGPETVAGQKFLSTLLRLQDLNITRDLFDNPTFQTLRDYTVALEPQQAGRSNPFAPIGVGGVYTPPLSEQNNGTTASANEQGGGAAAVGNAGASENTQTQAGSGF
ncbi:MAG: hypothetical protein COV10_02145 [Candidatus Vogelbacteria bacterium CG10_big_fil_rev_8_21_14_0_10_51_16]|uniref:Uncharacterized protein n=1 Tax=Candidatus Vogelbacteria bacterium CG10_big_fil_rev_8_21_14_0_10_51_16 TaxID=1975045 RepID=A0A2H0REI4_9BACT|nr:MAG: hypothetical protein COV10_02145 [Candidatus Vogelbacteria bacterium CG10_big_fil_rev_8_21_14_0_10_51_16]